MKVNKNSWHYKLLTENFCFISGWEEWHISNSLCLYFWQVMFRLVSGLGLGLIATSPLVFWGTLLLGLHPSDLVFFGRLLVGLGIFVTFALTAVGALASIVYAGEFIRDKLPRKEYKEKESNLFVEYIKAKKNKLCPIIEFVEEEK